MQRYNISILPTSEEKYYRIAKIIEKYMEENSIDFIKIKNNDIIDYFKENKQFHMSVDIGKIHFQDVLKSEDIYNFYLYLGNNLFPSIVSLESIITNIIKLNFPKLYVDFNINIPGVETDLLLFKSFAINFSILENDD